jgi:hypothetical protein
MQFLIACACAIKQVPTCSVGYKAQINEALGATAQFIDVRSIAYIM